MKLSIKVDGAMVRQGIENVAAAIPQIGRQRIRTVMNRIVRRMQEYPPEPTGQSRAESHPVLGTIYRRAKGRYKRTGKLFASWKIEEIANGYAIENTAAHKGRRYGQYVVGDAYGTSQAWMHKGRWQLFRDVTDEEISKLPPAIEDEIVMVARRNGV